VATARVARWISSAESHKARFFVWELEVLTYRPMTLCGIQDYDESEDWLKHRVYASLPADIEDVCSVCALASLVTETER